MRFLILEKEKLYMVLLAIR